MITADFEIGFCIFNQILFLMLAHILVSWSVPPPPGLKYSGSPYLYLCINHQFERNLMSKFEFMPLPRNNPCEGCY
jgi:hypothetical protein